MLIEISVVTIAAAFVVLVIFAIIGIMSARKTMNEVNKTLHAVKKDLNDLSEESLKLIKNINETTADVKKKLHALNFLLKPFYEMENHESEHRKSKHYDLASEIMECITAGLVIYNKIKGGIREYGKTR